jgi:hypothetical protein
MRCSDREMEFRQGIDVQPGKDSAAGPGSENRSAERLMNPSVTDEDFCVGRV